MASARPLDDAAARRWVRAHVIAFVAILGVAIGLIIVDARIAEIIGQSRMPGFRTILVISVLLAGVGARALLAWRSATVDLQGRIFLIVTGLALLTAAAFGLADCRQEIRENFRAREAARNLSQSDRRRGQEFVHRLAMGRRAPV